MMGRLWQRVSHQRQVRRALAGAALATMIAGAVSADPLQAVGRKATPAEVAAWNIDVRADLQGLPKGSGSVTRGEQVWESRCAACHGTFGEANHMFPPLVGGTSAADIASGHAASLARGDVAQRSTIMKLARISTLWDYINRAMPWDAPKSLTTDDVYAVSAYILNLADIVPADYVLSDQNMAEVQRRLPNRNGLSSFDALWQTRGKGDVRNVACMRDCAADVLVTSFLPETSRTAHGNLAEQDRLVGPSRGSDTRARAVSTIHAPVSKAPVSKTAAAVPPAPGALAQNACTGCHAIGARLIGPGFEEVMARYRGKDGLEAYFAGKIRAGSAGLWGTLPMPPQAQVKEADVKAIAAWLAAGAR